MSTGLALVGGPRIHRPRGLPLVGHVPAFLADKLGFLDEACRSGAPVVELRLPARAYLLRDPADVRHVLVANSSNYDKGRRLTSRRGRRILGHGLLTSTGAAHARRRAALQPAFHPHNSIRVAGVAVPLVDEMVSRWPEGAEVDVSRELARLAQRAMITALFGVMGGDQRDALAADAATRQRFLDYVFGSRLPLPERLPTRTTRAYDRARRRLDDVILDAVRSRRKQPADDLLSALVGSRTDDGLALSDWELRDEVLTLLVTGHETVGDSLAWTWLELARHPDVARRVDEEVDAALGGRRPAAGDIGLLPYTVMVLAESMRLHPTTWIYVRVAREGDTLPSGLGLAPQSKLYVCPWVLHRDPRRFPDPGRFDPERFRDARDHQAFAYIPFGAGPRVCIGRSTARMETTLVVARLAQLVRFTLVAGQEVRAQPGLTLRPRPGIRALVHHR